MAKIKEIIIWTIIVITAVIAMATPFIAIDVNGKLATNSYSVEEKYLNDYETKLSNNEILYVFEVKNDEYSNVEIYNSNIVNIYDKGSEEDKYIKKHFNYFEKVIKVDFYR